MTERNRYREESPQGAYRRSRYSETAAGPAMYRRGASSSRRTYSSPSDLYEEPSRRGTRGRRPQKDRRNYGPIIGILVAVFIVAAIAIAFLTVRAKWADDEAGGGDRSTEEVVITIEEGSSASDIAKQLLDEDIINSYFAFYKYAVKNDYASSFQTGEFKVTQAMSYEELCTVLTTVEAARTETVTVTFPEGYTFMQIAERLEENGVCAADDFISTLKETDSFGFDFESEIGTSDLRIFKYEGYLYPATYEFYLGSTPTEVVEKLFSAFEYQVYEEYKDEIDSSGYTLDEIITLASVIQRESFGEENMKMVSSVFHNRLNIGMGLQSDATRDFLTTYEDYGVSYTTEQADAYDTYQINGLPVGPINNPGLAAIIAALEPADTSYFYFVTDPDGNYYWAETYDEHIANQTW